MDEYFFGDVSCEFNEIVGLMSIYTVFKKSLHSNSNN